MTAAKDGCKGEPASPFPLRMLFVACSRHCFTALCTDVGRKRFEVSCLNSAWRLCWNEASVGILNFVPKLFSAGRRTMNNLLEIMAPFNGIPTPSQQVALAIIPKVTSALSIFGSAYITVDVLRPKRRLNIQSYQRLLVGMSICDLSMSGGIFMSTWPMPREVPNVYGNVGTVQTCSAQGFFEQFGVSTVMCEFHIIFPCVIYWYHSLPSNNNVYKTHDQICIYHRLFRCTWYVCSYDDSLSFCSFQTRQV